MIIKKDIDTIQGYFGDYSNLPKGNAIGVAIPEGGNELSEFLRKCSKEKIPVTISGGGTGTTGGRIPYGGYVLSTERLNRVKKIGGDYVVVEPGVLYKDLELELEKRGLVFPPNPTETTAMIGGNIATNASGSRSFRYGATRKFVNRLKVILSSGDVLDIRRGEITADNEDMFNLELPSGRLLNFRRPMYKMPDVKNSAGYYTKSGTDIIDLFIGSEGTIGVIAEIELKVIKMFNNLCAFFVFLREENHSLRMVKDIINLSKTNLNVDPCAIEYFDSNSLGLLRDKFPQIPQTARGALYIEQDIKNENIILKAWSDFFKEYGIADSCVWFGGTERDLSLYRDIRHALPERINELVRQYKNTKLSSDIAVPEEKIEEMTAFYEENFSSSGIKYFIFGHIGDMHLHTNLLPKTSREIKLANDIYLDIMKKAVSLGGTISAEHGVGKIKHQYLEIMYGTNGIKEMARVKKILDPACILNPDNIFSKEYLC